MSKKSTKKRPSAVTKISKRNGELVTHDTEKIINAAHKAMLAANEGSLKEAEKIAKKVERELKRLYGKEPNYIPHVEQVQDLVEKSLMLNDYLASAKAFILYRKERAELRDLVRMNQLKTSETFKQNVKKSKEYFRNTLGELIYYRTYSRWLEDKGRRESWLETVTRFSDFMKENLGNKLSTKDYQEVHDAILNHEVVPSMRLLWSSGDAARATNIAAYNCSFIAISDLRDFSEIMYISMCGCGAGFSVEEKTVNQLPTIKPQKKGKKIRHVVGDSKEGWANALHLGLRTWYEGSDIEFDYSKVRPRGARLKTMGGRASGYKPLENLMQFAKEKILANQGKKLSTIDVHDIACKVGEVVVAGGVRRSAMISLSELDDLEMRKAKDGQFWLNEPQRSMANNSAVYNTKPNSTEFLAEWLSLAQSGSGERGIFNRGNVLEQLPKRRRAIFDNHVDTCGTNPCGEIILRSRQFCNLTAIVVREYDNEESLLRKIRIATILGTYQASLLDFPFLHEDWKKNCVEEALLGVSFTGYYDNKLVRTEKMLQKMRDTSVVVNKKYAKKIGINPSTCITCVKPSGNSSQLLDTASGMHARFAPYYIRRIRINATDPLLEMLRDQGVPCHPEVGQSPETASTFVMEFPVKAPKGAIVKDDISAIDLLEEWKKIKVNFTEHNPSATIYVGPAEWIEVAQWVYDNWDIVGGLSFLPRSEHVYQLAPYEEIDAKTYKELAKRVANVDFSKLVYYEFSDMTEGAKEYACVGGACEL